MQIDGEAGNGSPKVGRLGSHWSPALSAFFANRGRFHSPFCPSPLVVVPARPRLEGWREAGVSGWPGVFWAAFLVADPHSGTVRGLWNWTGHSCCGPALALYGGISLCLGGRVCLDRSRARYMERCNSCSLLVDHPGMAALLALHRVALGPDGLFAPLVADDATAGVSGGGFGPRMDGHTGLTPPFQVPG